MTLTLGPFSQTRLRPLHAFAKPLHHVEFSDLAGLSLGGAQASANFLPALIENFVDGHLRDGVADDLLFREHGFELADEVGGAHDLFAELRRNSTVPASTIETYMMSLLGEYCMAMRSRSSSIASRPEASSCQLE